FPIEHDVTQVPTFAGKQRDNVGDRALRGGRRHRLAGVRMATEQSFSGCLLAAFRKLHANDAAVAPDNAAAPDRCFKQRITGIVGTVFARTIFAHAVNIVWRTRGADPFTACCRDQLSWQPAELSGSAARGPR